MQLESKLSHSFEEIINNSAELAVGVSGGPDSMALSILSSKLFNQKRINLTCLIVDHKLRAESTDEAKQVKNYLSKLGINSIILAWEHENIKFSNIQEQARNARYKLMTDYCKQNNISHLALAHNMEDQVENFFIRLFRGASLFGLAHMDRNIVVAGVNIIRPFLDVHKSLILRYLADEGHFYVNDPSNLNPRFARSIIRNMLDSAEFLRLSNQTSKDVLVRRVFNITKELYSLKENDVNELENLYKNYVIKDDGAEILINTQLFGCDKKLVLRLISNLLQKFSNLKSPPRYKSLENIFARIASGNFKSFTLARAIIKPCKNIIRISKESRK